MFKTSLCIVLVCLGAALAQGAATSGTSTEDVQAEHGAIGNAPVAAAGHTQDPGAQWFPDAGLGLFIHWGIASVKGLNISWSMIDGLGGKPAQITPNDYWAMAKSFNPDKCDPNKWLKAAKDAGFTYAVLTTRHHEGFALWPSNYGDFSTKNYMGGRDLVKEYVDACRANGLKVGLYYSPPNWYFDRDFHNFAMGGKSPPEGPDLKPRTDRKTPEEIAEHNKEYAAMVRGQLEELLTRYGKIDLLWFDGKIPGSTGEEVMPIERIRQLQPGIVINGRFHGHGDFINYERKLTTNKVATGWAEYCNTWTSAWPYTKGQKFRAPGYIIGQYVTCRSLHINYLPSVGPMANGEMPDDVYENLAIVGSWMKANGASVKGTQPLPADETASVPGTSSGSTRYLFALPQFKDGGQNNQVYAEDIVPAQDETLTLGGVRQPAGVKLLGDGSKLEWSYTNGTLSIKLPAAKRTTLVDVAEVDLK